LKKQEGNKLITVKNLTKKYKELTVLNNISLEIGDGEIYGIVGVSGVGKSTLLGCLNGLETYSQGTVCVDGTYVEKLKGRELREFRKNMGMIFQSFSLIGRKTVYQNIAFPMECWGYQRNEIDRRVRELAGLVGIEDKLPERPDNLSGGQKQRVAIARALMLEPKYILCDECTSALDPRTTNSILNLLRDICEKLGITIILVTHEMSVIKRICQKIAILEGGRIAESGSVRQIFSEQPEALLNLTGEERRQEILSCSCLLEVKETDLKKIQMLMQENNLDYRERKKEEIIC